MSTSRDFWLACGHHLLDRDAAGRLLVTDEFLKAYLAHRSSREENFLAFSRRHEVDALKAMSDAEAAE